MDSTTCNVQHHGQQEQMPDVVDGLMPAPSSIKEQMPELAAMLQSLAANIGREAVQSQVKASMDLRAAFDADDYAGVNAVYRRGDGWIFWPENGYCLGVPATAMRAFAQRHRGNA